MKKRKILILCLVVLSLLPLIINFYVISNNIKDIYNIENVQDKYDIALILGCSVINNNTPSKLLQDRLDKGIELYNNKLVDKILISGDHQTNYSEVNVMKNYLLENNIKEEDIITDYIGYSTGDSLINYKNNYKDQSVIIVTQQYHLYRALNISKNLKIKAIGVKAKEINYSGIMYRETREILARNKDMVKFMFIH